METIGAPLLDDTAAARLVGQRYYAGGRGGALAPLRVIEAQPHGCANFVLHVAPAAVLQPFVAYSRPARFFALERSPTTREAVLRSSMDAIGAAGGSGEFAIEQVWRFKPSKGDEALVVAILQSALDDWKERAAVRAGEVDAVLLFREDGAKLTLVDQIVWVVKAADDRRVLPEVMAVAQNPFDGRLELFVQYLFFEGYEVTAYDITDGRLLPRTRAECSF